MEYQEPKDDYMQLYKASRVENRKIIGSERFEEMANKYWELLRAHESQDIKLKTISEEQYTALFKRIYKVLLPLYREDEMSSEVAQMWLMDNKSQKHMTYRLFQKSLFRIAHQWSTHIDLDEYHELLQKVFDRITIKKIVDHKDSSEFIQYPTVQIELVEENDQGTRDSKDAPQTPEWELCDEDEENMSNYEYKYEEDGENMTVQKFKKLRVEEGGDRQGAGSGLQGQTLSVRDAIFYKEDILYQVQAKHLHDKHDILLDVMAPMDDIFPFGYFVEQFLTATKQDVYEKQQKSKRAKKEAMLKMKRDLDKGDTSTKLQSKLVVQGEDDTGLIDAYGKTIYPTFSITSLNNTEIKTRAKVVDSFYNQIRQMLKDAGSLDLRLHMIHPRCAKTKKAPRPPLGNEPMTVINKMGYNPAIERRILYKVLPVYSQGDVMRVININYLIKHPDFEVAYRSDVKRVENNNKLAIKGREDFERDEQFVNVETSYKRLLEIMLTKKFESMYTDALNMDEQEEKRIENVVEKEDARVQQVKHHEHLTSKGIFEKYEEKQFIKAIQGPFYGLTSKDGCIEDDYVNSNMQDLIDYANAEVLRILVLGKPRSGKSTLASKLQQKLDILHISVDIWINRLLEKIKNREPEDDDQGDQGDEDGEKKPIKWLSDLEEEISEGLKVGKGPSDEQVIQILKQEINSSVAKTKGFILDLSFYQRDQSFAQTIRSQKLVEEGSFTHVVEIQMDDEEIKVRTAGMRLSLADGKVYSKWERDELAKPKPPKYDEDGNLIEDDDDDDQDDDAENPKPKPIDETTLVMRECDDKDTLLQEIIYYNSAERNSFNDLMIKFHNHQYLKIDASGLTPDELAETAEIRLRPNQHLPLRPIAKQIEGAGDFKSLLTEGIEENELPRKYSLWKQIDPVALYNKKVIPGVPDNAASYANHAFVFATEENMKAFIEEPKKYLKTAPRMPDEYRVLMMGPKGIGHYEHAENLHKKYGWTIIDFPKLVHEKMTEILANEVHLPNNVVENLSAISMSQEEINEIKDGKVMPAWKFIPWIFEFLGIELMEKVVKPEDDVVPNFDDMTEEEKKEWDEKEKKKEKIKEQKRKEEMQKQAEKEERHRKREEARANNQDLAELGLEESEEEPIVIDDLSIDQLVVKVDEETQKAPFIGGFILLGFPQNEEHINKLKGHGIEFDRVLFLNDPSEEDAGKQTKEKMKSIDHLYDWDAELELANKAIGVVKEHIGEDLVREIDATGTDEEVLVKLLKELDPFVLQCDNPEDVRVTADLGEEDRKLPKGDFGDYCPVTYVDESFLVKGNPEFEHTVHGKTYLFAGEKEHEIFKKDPSKYLIVQQGKAKLPLQPPNPKIMIMGMKGSGISTQIRMICEKYRLDEFVLKDEYLDRLKSEKDLRKRQRLLERGFKPLPPKEDEEENDPVDPEIEEDPEDFNKEEHEVTLMKDIFDASKGLIIDGTWTTLPEDVVGQPLQDLLDQSRRYPEVVIMLKCSEESTFTRMIDFDSIRAEYERLEEERIEKRKQERDEARKAKQEELKESLGEPNEDKTQEEIDQEYNEGMEKWEEEQDEEDATWKEEDPDKPVYEEMLDKFKEQLREQREKDEGFLEEFGTALKEKGVRVIDDLEADVSADFVQIKLLDKIKDHFLYRTDMIEKEQVSVLKPEEVKWLEQSYIYKHSKFGPNCPLHISNPIKSREHAVLYRERLIFLTNNKAVDMFCKSPSQYAIEGQTIPLDTPIKSKIFVLGLSKMGKTTLCETVAAKLNLVHLQMADVIEYSMNKDCGFSAQLREKMKLQGMELNDETLVALLQKRVQAPDCYSQGFILEDFPRTKGQAVLMSQKGLVPTNVIHLRGTFQEAYKRTEATKLTDFGSNRIILGSRLRHYQQNLTHVTNFYNSTYSSLQEIDAFKSKWFIQDQAIKNIESNLNSRQQFCKQFFFDKSEKHPCIMKDLNCDISMMRQSLSQFGYYCPVTFRNEKKYFKCNFDFENCVLYNHQFYYFKSQTERDIFLEYPKTFIEGIIFSSAKGLPFRIQQHKAAEIFAQEKSQQGYCPVTLMDEERLVRGDQMLIISYRENKFTFASEFKLQKFFQQPQRYHKVNLPVKMPPNDDKVGLFSLHKLDDSITFMEQALGTIVTQGLREVGDNRIKYPTLSCKETMLKLFALYLKFANPANTEHKKKKAHDQMMKFIWRCEIQNVLYDTHIEKAKKKAKGKWPEFKENKYNELGSEYDQILKEVEKEKQENFMSYLK